MEIDQQPPTKLLRYIKMNSFWSVGVLFKVSSATKTVEEMLKQISLIEQGGATNNNRSAPKSEEEAASRQEWKFWQTQPVASIGEKIASENNGPVEENKPHEELRQEPYKLPDGFSWDEIDILDEAQVSAFLIHRTFLLILPDGISSWQNYTFY